MSLMSESVKAQMKPGDLCDVVDQDGVCRRVLVTGFGLGWVAGIIDGRYRDFDCPLQTSVVMVGWLRHRWRTGAMTCLDEPGIAIAELEDIRQAMEKAVAAQ